MKNINVSMSCLCLCANENNLHSQISRKRPALPATSFQTNQSLQVKAGLFKAQLGSSPGLERILILRFVSQSECKILFNYAILARIMVSHAYI